MKNLLNIYIIYRLLQKIEIIIINVVIKLYMLVHNNIKLHNTTYCSFCGNIDHTSKTCNIEHAMAPIFKKEVGIYMENYISDNINCPNCSNKTLYALGNHTPSLDLICKSCNKIFELKSKCLSQSVLPLDIYCNGGNFIEFKKNILSGLNLIVVIYGVNREKKEIKIREIYYAPNELLKNNSIINIIQKKNCSLSSIFIKNKNFLKQIIINNKLISFKKLYDNLILNNHTLKN
jgi:hypothetical protein